MQLAVLDTNFNTVAFVDVFDSLIWNDKYSSCGDFELVTSVDLDLLSIISGYSQDDYYLYLKESEHMMIIESVLIETDPDSGSSLKITGRSLESILERRIIWKQTILNGTVEACIQQLLNENVISPTDNDRKIPNFIFESSGDSSITSSTMKCQFTGDNLYEAICTICDTFGFGFKVILNSQNKFVFSLYNGDDRSYGQMTNPYVIFSNGFENIKTTSYLESISAYKNVTLVAGEGEGTERKTTTVGSGTGIARRELFTDARDISSTTDGEDLTEEEYNELLNERGNEKLSKYIFVRSFEGGIDTTQTFKYGEDFFIGDIVQIVNEYGLEGRVRISEIIFSQDSTGINIYPTFYSLD